MPEIGVYDVDFARQARSYIEQQMRNGGSQQGRQPMLDGGGGGGGSFRIVRTMTAHAAGKQENCMVLSGEKGKEKPTGTIIKCFNRFGGLSKNSTAIAAYVANGWELLAAVCGGGGEEEESDESPSNEDGPVEEDEPSGEDEGEE